MSRRVLVAFAAFVLTAGLVGTVYLWSELRAWDAIVTDRFRTHRWNFPSKISAEPTTFYPGLILEPIEAQAALERVGYRRVNEAPLKHGEFIMSDAEVLISLRNEKVRPPEDQLIRILRGRGHVIQRIEDGLTRDELPFAELEPKLITALYEGNWEERRLVTLEEVPSLLVQAILDTEDQRFFSHHGIDIIGLTRAVFVNLTAGRMRQGGSTLTQQLMKNFFLTDERSFNRKRREMVMALIVEHRFDKQEILENYLNEIYLGQRGAQAIHGVREAAQHYFAKELMDLSIGEMAVLAGIIRGPSLYSPLRHPERARSRRNTVLKAMLESEHLTQAQFDAAVAEPLVTAEIPAHADDAPYFVDFVRQELTASYAAEVLSAEGLDVETTLDTRLQLLAEEALQSGLDALERRHPRLRSQDPAARLQGCLIAVEPQTGAIRAMMGGRDYRFTQFNRCSQARRQPGSVFKPFVYTAAFEAPAGRGHILPTTPILDEPFTWPFEGRKWSPANYDKQYAGSVSVRQALERSLNAATARIAQDVGLPAIIETAHRMGINSPIAEYPSIVLGAAEVSPLEVAQAFSVLANGGVRADLVSIKRIRARDGIALERRPVRFEQVISPDSAFLVTHLLEGVLDHGTGRAARRGGWTRPAAGKTGTTSDYRDAWFAGYTPDLVTIVWVGFDEPQNLHLTGGDAALPIWSDFMRRALSPRPEQQFVAPPSITVVRIDPESGQLAGEDCPQSIDEAFRAAEVPMEPCSLHASAPPDEPESIDGAERSADTDEGETPVLRDDEADE